MKVQKQIKLSNIWAKNKIKKLGSHTHTNSYNLNKDHNICNLHFSNFFYKFFTRHIFHLPNSNNSELIWVYMHIKMSICRDQVPSQSQTQGLAHTSWMFIGHWGTVEPWLNN